MNSIRARRVVLGVILALALVLAWQAWLVVRANELLASTLSFSKTCQAGDAGYCAVTVSTARNLEGLLRQLPSIIEEAFVDQHSLRLLRSEILPPLKPLVEERRRKWQEEDRQLTRFREEAIDKHARLAEREKQELASLYTRYDDLAAPKLLYRCGNTLNLLAGTGLQNYNALYEQATRECRLDGREFQIVRSAK